MRKADLLEKENLPQGRLPAGGMTGRRAACWGENLPPRLFRRRRSGCITKLGAGKPEVRRYEAGSGGVDALPGRVPDGDLRVLAGFWAWRRPHLEPLSGPGVVVPSAASCMGRRIAPRGWQV